ncbi:MAG: Coenzyme F420 hydrogenase/dehydrogenase, beta subunit C-terminal domain, partial [Bacillales bacterium]|nr:Coenzyme F420 hydrogenase/dehydrogenase, beta subunit C-terminal domain [Bacillales bacterium]
MNQINKENCCVCKACEQVCPKKAISFSLDEVGFEYPKIDNRKCINCQKCLKVCPFVNFQNSINYGTQHCYIVASKNDEILLSSSSGGAFSLITNVLSEKVIVYGVEMDKEFNVFHSFSLNNKDIAKYRKSKYVKSNTHYIYCTIKEQLDLNETVLFTGTPCQCSGLKLFLGKEYENLIIVDLLCKSTPNNTLFKKYINSLEKKYKQKIINIVMRNKSKIDFTKKKDVKSYRVNTDIKIELSNGNKIISSKNDWWMQAFLGGYLAYSSCFNCPFTQQNRVGDITIFDFWGLNDKSFKNYKGVSGVLTNSIKGEQIVKTIVDCD